MAFEGLQDRLQGVFKKLRGHGKLTETNIEEMLKEIRIALLEADVNFKVVKQFINDVKEKAIGEKVIGSLNPSQMVVKIVKDELVDLFGKETIPLTFNTNRPTVILMVGLNGSGKTTTSGKLAKLLKKQGKNPLLVAADIYRPAAVEQLKTLAKQIGVECFHIPNEAVCTDVDAVAHIVFVKELHPFRHHTEETVGTLHVLAQLGRGHLRFGYRRPVINAPCTAVAHTLLMVERNLKDTFPGVQHVLGEIFEKGFVPTIKEVVIAVFLKGFPFVDDCLEVILSGRFVRTGQGPVHLQAVAGPLQVDAH